MEIIKCKNCGAQLDITKAVGGVAECEFCHSKHTLAKSTDTNAVNFLRMGEHNLDVCKFDDAYTAFAKAAQYDSNESEAYFGMALSEYRVQYIKDIVNNRLQPICHEISDKVFGDNKNYNAALASASPQQRTEYMRKAGEIDYIRTEFRKLKQSGLDYDCFICVKVTDENKRKTKDSDTANDIYYYLKDKGYRPFFSEREIQNQTGVDYEARILYALYTAPCMIVLCGNESYLQTPWVKNEYTRFIELINDEVKEIDSITIGFFDDPIERLPGRSGRLQGVCLGKPDAYSKIEDFVARHYGAKSQTVQIARKTYDNKEYVKKVLAKSQIKKRVFEKYMQSELSVSEQAQLNIIKALLDSGDFDVAISRCSSVLMSNNSCSDAHWYKFLAVNKCKNIYEFINAKKEIDNFEYLESAIATAGSELKGTYYFALFERAKQDKKIYIYNEYISLPDSKDDEIATLTELMYESIMQGTAIDDPIAIFDAIIKTVDKTELYIKMNSEFADKLFRDGRINVSLTYYLKVLEFDPANQKALWYAFIIKNDLVEDEKMLAYLSINDNYVNIENELYAFGFNELASGQLFNISIKAVGNQGLKFEWLDFLFSLIPDTRQDIYLQCLYRVVDKFIEYRMFALANKYNDMIIAADKLDDHAYFNRVFITYRASSSSDLIDVSDTLYDNEDFAKAVEVYAEKNVGNQNKYIELVNELRKEKVIKEQRMAQLRLEKEIKAQQEKERRENQQKLKREYLAKQEIEIEERKRREKIESENAAIAAKVAHKRSVRKKLLDSMQWILYLLPSTFMAIIMILSFVNPAIVFHNIHYGWIIGLYIAIPISICLIAMVSYSKFGMLEDSKKKLTVVILYNIIGLVMMAIRLITLSTGTIYIGSIYDFEALENMPVANCYQLTNDIDFENKDFKQIDYLPQNIVFDGNGYVISNVSITCVSDSSEIVKSGSSSTYWYTGGLFGVCEGTIRNLTVENIKIVISGKAKHQPQSSGWNEVTYPDYLCVGAIVGINNGGTIENCNVSKCLIDLSMSEDYNIPDSSKYGLPGICGWNFTYKKGKFINCEITDFTYNV